MDTINNSQYSIQYHPKQFAEELSGIGQARHIQSMFPMQKIVTKENLY